MNSFFDIFKWDRFVAPSAVELLFWLLAAISLIVGGYGVMLGVQVLSADEIGGLVGIALSIVGAVTGVVFARIVCEAVVILFRMNDRLSEIAERADGAAEPEVETARSSERGQRPPRQERREPLAVELVEIDHRVAAAEAMEARVPEPRFQETRNWEVRAPDARRIEPRSWEVRTPEGRSTRPADPPPAPPESRHPDSRPAAASHSEARPPQARYSEARPADPRHTEPRHAEARPAAPPHQETRHIEHRQGEGRSSDSRHVETRHIEPRAAERRPAEGRTGESRPAEPRGHDLPREARGSEPREPLPRLPERAPEMRPPLRQPEAEQRPAPPPPKREDLRTLPEAKAFDVKDFAPPRPNGSMASPPETTPLPALAAPKPAPEADAGAPPPMRLEADPVTADIASAIAQAMAVRSTPPPDAAEEAAAPVPPSADSPRQGRGAERKASDGKPGNGKRPEGRPSSRKSRQKSGSAAKPAEPS